MMTMSWMGAVQLRREGVDRQRRSRMRAKREPRDVRHVEEPSAEVDTAHVGADVVDESTVGDDGARFARKDQRLPVQRRDQGRSSEHTCAGRVLEERMKAERGGDLHAPQAKREADADADGLRLVARDAAVRVVGVRAEGDEGAGDERRRDEKAVRDDL